MSLNKKQFKFAWYLSLLIQFAFAKGYMVRLDDVYAKTGHKINSMHYKHLAVDMPLFKLNEDDKLIYLMETKDYKFLGDFWEALDPECVWGGRWNDGNHFQYGHG